MKFVQFDFFEVENGINKMQLPEAGGGDLSKFLKNPRVS